MGNVLNGWSYAFISMACLGVSNFLYAVEYIDVSAGSTVRSLSFVVTACCAFFFYKEQLGAKDLAAMGLALAAVLLSGWHPEH